MPDWSFFRDRDGNRYFYDKAGKIRITSIPQYNVTPVSGDGIDYYLNLGIELSDSGDYLRGLTILKSIIAMPVKNNRIYTASSMAVKTVSILEKKHGVRFKMMDEDACLLFFREDNIFTFINERMRYSLSVPGKIELINKRDRGADLYRYMGVKLGVNLKNANEKKSYDFIIAIDSEKFGKKISFVSEYKNYVQGRIPRERTTLDIISSDELSMWYSFKNSDPRVAGVFGFVINGRFGYSIRILCSEKKYISLKKIIQSITESFKTVSE